MHHTDHSDHPVGQVVSRRQALHLFTAPLLLKLAGCSSAEGEPMIGSCIVRPELTEGPFYVAGDLLRSDIRDDRPGVPLTLRFQVSGVSGDTCSALPNAIVDVWHTDANGDYSGVGALREARFLRGSQVTDAAGQAVFTTIYPGWYPGRAVHIHFKVRSARDATSSYEFTSQLFFDDALSEQVYQNEPYRSRGAQNTTNARDGIYRRGGGDEMLLAVTESAEGYTATFDIGLMV